ncbi:hypothetical protein BH10BAC2_BH10BAC2_45300 [soil metagenome]
MSRLLPFACAILLFISGNAAAQKLKVAPPGTIHLKDNLYIDKIPVSNNSYKEFLYSIEQFWSEKTHANIADLPMYGLQFTETGEEDNMRVSFTNKNGSFVFDTSNLQPDESFYQRMKIPDYLVVDLATNLTMEYYSKAMAYKNNPVVYVTHEQAEMFCKWRSDMVMLHYSVASGGKGERKKYYSKITYRLMTEDEWKYAYNNKGQLLLSDFGIRTDFNKKALASNIAVDSRRKEASINIYANNFAELLLEKKSMIGVLWNNTNQISQNIITNSYAPASNVGFRCICEVE